MVGIFHGYVNNQMVIQIYLVLMSTESEPKDTQRRSQGNVNDDNVISFVCVFFQKQ